VFSDQFLLPLCCHTIFILLSGHLGRLDLFLLNLLLDGPMFLDKGFDRVAIDILATEKAVADARKSGAKSVSISFCEVNREAASLLAQAH